ncbi:hypothetical protein BROUX41_004913 [Berkeleyomyces rouxiae]|uniref:uncharacterized protein n=1 Tax=Berkeleyomyces rouxiae TaxID=2035830 RepID=UPI003B79A9C3
MSVAISKTPALDIPKHNIFNWALEQPFARESSYLPPSKCVPIFSEDRPIFVDNHTERPLTFGRIRHDGRKVAASLQALGLHFNDTIKLPATPTCASPEIAPVVLIQLPNCQPMIPLVMGVFAAGLTATLVSPALSAEEISWILQSSRPRVLITARVCLPAMEKALDKQDDKAYFGAIKTFVVDAAEDTYPETSVNAFDSSVVQDWKVLLHPAFSSGFNACFLPQEAWANRTALILWSSGTSGRSKGVLLSHHAINTNITALWMDFDHPGFQHQKWLGYVPFYHVFGFVSTFMLTMCTGATVYIMQSFSLQTMLAAVPKRKITYLHMAPPVAVMLAKSPIVESYAKRDANGDNAFKSVTGGLTGGAPLGHDIIAQVYDRLGFRIEIGYGMSEAGSIAAQRGLSHKSMQLQAGTTGLPHTGVEIMISSGQDDVKGNKVRPALINTPGEILVRSSTLMSAYLPLCGLTPGASIDMGPTMDALTPDGWIRTGDVGTIDASGFLRITDRIKELIKVRAYQVAPAELEALLCSHDKVQDAGVIGVYDHSEATEWPRAFVVVQDQNQSKQQLTEISEELKRLVEAKTAKYKWLIGGMVFVKQIPKSPSGKILRRLLQDGKVEGLDVSLYVKKYRPAKL